MELRSQENQIGIPNSSLYDSSNLPNREIRGDQSQNSVFSTQTLDHRHPNNLHRTQKSRRDHQPNQDPNPAPAESSKVTNITPTTTSPNNSVGSPSFRYRECMKNHAANSGGHVLDGCGEFMPGGEEGTLEFFKCAACECHRNFHRKEIDGCGDYSHSQHQPNFHYNYNGNFSISAPIRPVVTPIIPQQTLHHRRFSVSHCQPVMVAFGSGSGSGGAAESSSEDLGVFHCDEEGGQRQHLGQSKKRFRTKFSEEQKEKMMEFAERLGWRMQRGDEEDEVVKFCEEVGIKRQVFKVWMHNNKQARKRKQAK